MQKWEVINQLIFNGYNIERADSSTLYFKKKVGNVACSAYVGDIGFGVNKGYIGEKGYFEDFFSSFSSLERTSDQTVKNKNLNKSVIL